MVEETVMFKWHILLYLWIFKHLIPFLSVILWFNINPLRCKSSYYGFAVVKIIVHEIGSFSAYYNNSHPKYSLIYWVHHGERSLRGQNGSQQKADCQNVLLLEILSLSFLLESFLQTPATADGPRKVFTPN